MNKVLTISVLAGVLCVAGCKEKKTHDDIIAPRIETPAPSGPERMADSRVERDVQWLGKNYKVEVWRRADDSLRMVKDETGQAYVDNRISLRVIRADGSVCFSRTFTKSAFESLLDDDYRKTGILEGFVYDKVDGNRLVFAASVCHPRTDEYIPIVVTVNNFGDVNIELDTQLDTNGGDEEDQ